MHIFSVNADGTDVQQVTTGDGFEDFPSVSPDGQTVAFDHAGPGPGSDSIVNLGIDLMDIDGSNVRDLVAPPEDPAFDTFPAFSPDGKRIAFVRRLVHTPGRAESAIFVVNADGSDLLQLTPDTSMSPGPPRWSPNGEQIAFSDNAESGDASTAVNVWLVDPDGSNLRQVTNNGPGAFDADPEFSPDGDRLVVFRYRASAGTRNTLWTMNLDGTDAVQIYGGREGYYVAWPRWEPTERTNQ
jgi:TolB protein